jgi:hypothetical protein
MFQGTAFTVQGRKSTILLDVLYSGPRDNRFHEKKLFSLYVDFNQLFT